MSAHRYGRFDADTDGPTDGHHTTGELAAWPAEIVAVRSDGRRLGLDPIATQVGRGLTWRLSGQGRSLGEPRPDFDSWPSGESLAVSGPADFATQMSKKHSYPPNAPVRDTVINQNTLHLNARGSSGGCGILAIRRARDSP